MKNQITKIKCSADMGSLKIFDDNFSAFFHNGYGDCIFSVTIILDKKEIIDTDKWEYLELLEVKNKASVASYDCGDEEAYSLPRGRYFIYRKQNKSGDMLIHRFEEELI